MNITRSMLTLALIIGGLAAASYDIGASVDLRTGVRTSPPDVQIVTIVNKDQFEGNWKEFKGDLKKKWGKFTDDDLLVIEGNYDKFEGKMQERYGKRKEEVKRWTDNWFKKHESKR